VVQALAGAFFLFEARLFIMPLRAHLRRNKNEEGGEGGEGDSGGNARWYPARIINEVWKEAASDPKEGWYLGRNAKALKQVILAPNAAPVGRTDTATAAETLARRLHNRYVYSEGPVVRKHKTFSVNARTLLVRARTQPVRIPTPRASLLADSCFGSH
jgi:hypothetical protein